MSERWYQQSGWVLHLTAKMPESRKDFVFFLSAVGCGTMEELFETEEEVLTLAREHYEEERRVWMASLESLKGDYVTPNAIYRYSPEQTEECRSDYTQKLRVAERALALCQ